MTAADLLRERMARIGKVGGEATGPTKVRGGRSHYRRLALLGAVVRKARAWDRLKGL